MFTPINFQPETVQLLMQDLDVVLFQKFWYDLEARKKYQNTTKSTCQEYEK